MRNISLAGMVSSLGLAIATMAQPALAQSAAPAPAPAPQADTSAPAEKPAAKEGDIIVTAERKVQNLQKYAGTAVVLTGKSLKAVGVQNITDLEGRIPGLQILPNNNNIEVYIRGVGSSNNTELGDPAAGTHYDGVYIPRPAGFGSIFYDIDRVEVNIGPQGTLRGRNATAGTVNIIPWHPGLNVYDAYLEAGIGNYGQKSVEGMVNLPLTDNIAIRIAGAHTYHDSYTHNVGPVKGLRGPEWENNFSGRVQLLYKPSDQFDMLLTYDDTKEVGGGTIGTNLAGAEGDGVDVTAVDNPRNVYLYPTDPHVSTRHNGEKGEFNYHAKAFDIQFTASHRHLFSDFIGAPPGLLAYPGGLTSANNNDSTGAIATDYSHYETQTKSNSDTQELRLTAPKGSRFEWTIGGFHFNESQASFLGSVADQNAYFQGIEFNTRTQSQSWAGYTDDTFHVNDKLRLTGGLPVKLNISVFYEKYDNQVLSSLLSIASAAKLANASGQPISFPSNFTPGAIIVNYNYNAANSAIAGAQFDGSITIPQARLNIGFNALWLPEAKVKSSQSIEDFRFQSDIDPVDAGFRSIQGKRLPRTPKFQLNMQISQKFETRVGSFDYVIAPGYRSSSYATIFNGEDYGYEAFLAGKQITDVNGNLVNSPTTAYRARLNDTVAGFWTLDLGAGYSTPNGKLRIEGYANNVLYKNNITGILVSQTSGTVAFLPRPTTYGARFHYRF